MEGCCGSSVSGKFPPSAASLLNNVVHRCTFLSQTDWPCETKQAKKQTRKMMCLLSVKGWRWYKSKLDWILLASKQNLFNLCILMLATGTTTRETALTRTESQMNCVTTTDYHHLLCNIICSVYCTSWHIHKLNPVEGIVQHFKKCSYLLAHRATSVVWYHSHVCLINMKLYRQLIILETRESS